ncbi:fibronectin type III domain-containing protein [Blastococcus xanthinilyticus]|uniref:Fibronectin type-III domain-containing protein n=1 Tax=Blastococcus xanthinilyticus TaxID=1564164 RepID=A0A5S5CTY0_9ACTN|nr:fibronectin type III domain-containing protein [Blastococcus xanthinilyticus]TYP87261.1 hypothetical protein BD833_107202 [Blastococcus xanthinilyticus]
MHLAAPTRRALGLTAVGAIAMSSTILSLGGVALAAPSYTVSGTGPSAPVPAGICSVEWTLSGGSGGAASDGAAGALAGHVKVTLPAAENDVFTLNPGSVGEDGVADASGAAGGTNGSGAGSTQGGAGGLDATVGGGGGGAASVVLKSGSVYLLAFGGDGAGANGSGGAGGGNENNYGGNWLVGSPEAAATASVPGPGSISGVGVECPPPAPLDAPAAPEDLWVVGRDGGLELSFAPGWFDEDAQSPVTGWQVSTDDGATYKPLTVTQDGDELVGTVSGLTNGTTYKVRVRATSAVGPGAATASIAAMAYKPIGAPTNVVAKAGPSSIVFTWDAPSTEGTFDLAGYIVGGEAMSADGTDGASGIACETAADVRRCVMVATPGWTHTFGVTPVDSAGNPGLHSEVVTISDVPASSVAKTLPKADGTLTSDAKDGKVVAGQKVTISGKDFLPGSTVELVVYSTPVKLGEVTVLSDGTFSAEVTLPKDMENGVHHLVATGVDVNGNVRNLVVEVTVSGGTAVLALTGFSALPYLGAGALALLAGGGLLVASRRRQAA